MDMEEKIYNILRKHKLPLKKREEMMVDLLGLIKKGLPVVSKRYKFTFKDEYGLLIIVNEDTERKAYLSAFRSYEIPKDRQLTIISKEVNAC